NYIENCVAYTGTHDNDTLCGFVDSSPVYRLDFARRYLSPDSGETLSDAFLRAAWSSVAKLAIAPMQDFLNLPSSARMNTPSTVNDRNWRWRMKDGAITSELSEKLLSFNREFSRI
ncbi:MAG: 4-alpha-glucanotransferase, partial [Oscillospiraceae bacterium]|nr:4-alpha-glucanotransferase [Oscillospiraceae bacterium]